MTTECVFICESRGRGYGLAIGMVDGQKERNKSEAVGCYWGEPAFRALTEGKTASSACKGLTASASSSPVYSAPFSQTLSDPLFSKDALLRYSEQDVWSVHRSSRFVMVCSSCEICSSSPP